MTLLDVSRVELIVATSVLTGVSSYFVVEEAFVCNILGLRHLGARDVSGPLKKVLFTNS